MFSLFLSTILYLEASEEASSGMRPADAAESGLPNHSFQPSELTAAAIHAISIFDGNEPCWVT